MCIFYTTIKFCGTTWEHVCSRNVSELSNFVELTNVDDDCFRLLQIPLDVLKSDVHNSGRSGATCHMHSYAVRSLRNCR